MPTPRLVMCWSLSFYCAGMIVLALFPTDRISLVEWLIAASSAVAIGGLLLHGTRLRVPLARYAYLLTGFVGLATLIGYELTGGEDDPGYIRWRLGFLLASGVVAGFGSHLARDRV